MTNSNRTKCHVRVGPFCTYGKEFENMGEKFLKAYITFYELYHPNIRKDSECMRTLINNDYVNAKKKYPDPKPPSPSPSPTGISGLYVFLAIAVGAILVITALLFIIYFKRREPNDTNNSEEGPEP